MGSSFPSHSSAHIFLEPLEPRIAPATLLPDGKTVTFTDADGDEATIKFNQKLPQGADISAVVKFTGSDFGDSGPQTLGEIDLTAWGFQAGKSEKFTVEVSTKKVPEGNGKTDLPEIKADNLDLSGVKISGDLGKITAGDGTNANPTAIKTLEVGSLGATAAPGTASAITGGVGKLKTTGDIQNVTMTITAPDGTPGIGKLEVGGKIKAESTDTTGDSGRLVVNGHVTSAMIQGGLTGGGGANSGSLQVNGNIGSLNVGGGIEGSSGAGSGKISATGNIGVYVQTGDVQGGEGAGSGRVEAGGKVKKADIKGGVEGGEGAGSGGISFGSADTLAIHHITGGGGNDSGVVVLENGAKGAKIADAITGGDGVSSGAFLTSNAPVLNFFAGDIFGGSGQFSGGVFVAAGDFNGDGKPDIIAQAGVGSVQGDAANSGFAHFEPFVKTFTGSSIAGGAENFGGTVVLLGGGGKVAFKGEIQGGNGMNSGIFDAGLPVSSFAAGGLRGGGGNFSGGVRIASGDINGDGKEDIITSVNVPFLSGGSGNNSGVLDVGPSTKTFASSHIRGGSGDLSGSAVFHGNLGAAKFTGKMQDNTGRIEGGSGNGTGHLFVSGDLGAFALPFDLIGGPGTNGGIVHVGGDLGSASFGGIVGGSLFVEGGANKVSVKFDLLAVGPDGGVVIIENNLGSANFGGIVGGTVEARDIKTFNVRFGIFGDASVMAKGLLTSLAVKGDVMGSVLINVVDGAGKLDFGGNVTGSQIIGGFNASNPSFNNPDAFFASVNVKGNFQDSSIAVGVLDGEFIPGAGESTVGGIRALTIGGEVDIPDGAVAVAAAHVTKASIDRQKLPLQQGPKNDEIFGPGDNWILVTELPPS